MTREQLIQALRAHCRRRDLLFEVDRKKGNGSHYRVRVAGRVTTVQQHLNPGRIQRLLKQLGIDPDDL